MRHCLQLSTFEQDRDLSREEIELLQIELIKKITSVFLQSEQKKSDPWSPLLFSKTGDYLVKEAFKASISTFLITGFAHNCLILITRAV